MLYVKGHILDPGLSSGLTLSNAQTTIFISHDNANALLPLLRHLSAFMFSSVEAALLLTATDFTINNEVLVHKSTKRGRVLIVFGQAGMAVFLTRKWAKAGITGSIVEI